jgi:TolB-like protein
MIDGMRAWCGWALTAVLVSGTVPDLHAQCADGTPPPCRGTRPTAPTPSSIAVLYFDNLSRDSNDLYLTEGITEEIIARLGQVQRLAVKSRYAVRRFRGDDVRDPTSLGRALGVGHLVTGSLERAGARVRVRVELVAAPSGRHVWGGTFDRADGDVLAIEDDIAETVAGEVVGRLAPAERRLLTARPTGNREAYDHYLRGNFYFSRRTSEADGRRALEEYQAALRLDPSFAAAHGRLGFVYGVYASWPWPYPGLSHDSLVALGLAAANRAIALDSTSVDGWLARGFLLTPAPVTEDGWRGFALSPGLVAAELTCALGTTTCVREARRALERALDLDPRNAEVWYQYGRTFLLDTTGFHDAALERSLSLEPSRAVSAWLLGWSYLRQHRIAEALRMLDSAIALGRHDVSVHSLRIHARLAAGDIPGARADFAIVARMLAPTLPMDSVADVIHRSLEIIIDARAGDTSVARDRLDSMLSRHPPSNIQIGTMLVHIAAALVAVHSADQGLALLERISPAQLWFAIRNPLWDPVRTDPRFRRIETSVRAALPSTRVEQ